MAYFRQVYAVSEAGQPIAGARGRVYDIDDVDGTDPLAATDAAGIPIATVEISDLGVNQLFAVEDHTQVRWISEDGLVHAVFESLEGMEERAAEARATSETAVQQVSEVVGLVGIPGGIAALNSEGNVVDANGDVVGNDTRRSGAVVFASGATTARPTQSPDVMVLWLTDGTPPVNAIPGVDYWLNGGVDL